MKDGQTIGQWLNWDFETNGELEIRDKNRKRIYIEDSDGDWESMNTILKAIKSTLRVQMDFGENGNTILKANKSTLRIHVV